MTIKEAFEKLAESVKKGMKNPFFVMRNLSNDLEDISENIDGGGSEVEVDPLYNEGIPIADISVDGETSRLYTPYITTIDLYSDTEHKVGVWYHDSISEDVYERMLTFTNGISASGDLAIAHGIPNINRIVEFSGYGNVGNGAYTNFSTNNYHLNIHEVNRTNTMWDIGDGIASQISSLTCIIRYTKLST